MYHFRSKNAIPLAFGVLLCELMAACIVDILSSFVDRLHSGSECGETLFGRLYRNSQKFSIASVPAVLCWCAVLVDLLSRMLFFALGNSHSLATLDVSRGAYAGLRDFDKVLFWI